MRRQTATSTINAASLEQGGVVVEKDADFIESFLLLLVARPIASRRALQ